MNRAVWVLFLLCCAAIKCPVRQCCYALFTLRRKIETSLSDFLQLLYANGDKRNDILLVLASGYVEKVSFLCVQYLLEKMLLKLKEMKKNVNQKSVKRQDSIRNVSWNQSLIYKNKLWTVVYRWQNINLIGETCENLLHLICLLKYKH